MFERATALPSSGSALGMWPDAMATLERLDAADVVRTLGHPQDSAEVRDHHGRLLTRIPGQQGETVMVSRVALLHALHDIVGTVEFGSAVTDPSTLPHDMVVGADGINSVIRRHVAGREIVARDLGVTVVIAQFPGVTEMFTEYWGPGGSFGVTPLSIDRCDWHAAYRSPRPGSREAEWERDDPIGFAHDKYAGWTDNVTAAIGASTPDTVLTYHVRSIPVFHGWHRDNVVLIGDAVHAMAPNLGRGACETMLDAAALADAVTDVDPASRRSLDRAFATFEKARRPKVHRVATASRIMCRAGMMTHGVWARNLALKALP